jgi:methyl-accepting chemotaxis protein
MRLSSDLNDIFTRIRDSAESTSESSGGISRILLEQNEAFDQIFLTLKQISEGAEQVLASTRISGSEVDKVQGLIGELERVLARFGYDRADKAKGGRQ